MLTHLRARLTYANVVATLALFLSIAGGAYAAATVGSRDVENDSLKSVDLKNGAAVRSADVRDEDQKGGGLTGSDIREDTLGKVPSAESADFALDADSLDGEDSGDFLMDDMVVRKASVVVSPGEQGGGFKGCNPGEVLVSGGFDFAGDVKFSGPAPSAEGSTPTQWVVSAKNPTTDSTQTLVIYAICGS